MRPAWRATPKLHLRKPKIRRWGKAHPPKPFFDPSETTARAIEILENTAPRRRRGQRAQTKKTWLGWTAEMWENAHIFRWGQKHSNHCPCLNSRIKLWHGLQAAHLPPTG